MMTQWSTGPALCGFHERCQAATPEVHPPQRAQRHAMRSSRFRVCERDNCPPPTFPAPYLVREP
jgi:hypothetical protein